MCSRDVERPSFEVASSRSDVSCAFDFIVVPGVAGELAKFTPLNTLSLG